MNLTQSCGHVCKLSHMGNGCSPQSQGYIHNQRTSASGAVPSCTSFSPRPLTLTLLRHSYLNMMDWTTLTIAAGEDLVADVCLTQICKMRTGGCLVSTIPCGSHSKKRLAVN